MSLALAPVDAVEDLLGRFAHFRRRFFRVRTDFEADLMEWFGLNAGQARIVALEEVRPQYIKFDRSIIQNLDTADASRRRMVASLVSMVGELEIVPLAECVETAEECAACADAGFMLSQGFYHGKPQPATHYLQDQACTNHESAAK